MAEEDLWGGGAGSASFFELLHEHLSNDRIVVILKHCAEDYCDCLFLTQRTWSHHPYNE